MRVILADSGSGDLVRTLPVAVTCHDPGTMSSLSKHQGTATRGSRLAIRSLPILLASLALSSCFNYDAAKQGLSVRNETQSTVEIRFENDDRTLEVPPGEVVLGDDQGCFGTGGFVVLDDAGTQLAAFDGALCNLNIVNIAKDGTVTVYERSGETRAPA